MLIFMDSLCYLYYTSGQDFQMLLNFVILE